MLPDSMVVSSTTSCSLHNCALLILMSLRDQVVRCPRGYLCVTLNYIAVVSLPRHNRAMRFLAHKWLLLALLCPSLNLLASPLAAPGDMRLRSDLQLLNDARVINIPLTAWPVSLGDVHNAVGSADISDESDSVRQALNRVRDHLSWELEAGTVRFRVGASASENPRVIRSFENTPRADGEVSAGLSWLGERFVVNLAATYAANPFDGEEYRPDGTYVGVVLGNWMVTGGWQDRWWGPGRDGSLILGSNARPTPGITLQRNINTPFKTKWLSWMGPWTFTTFMDQLDDDRYVNDALLFGMRGSIRPPRTGLEIGISRTAQWCGDNRPCDLDTFLDLLVGNDNQGVNVDPEDEPGNQLGGFDIRWNLPRKIPVALYMQWIGEDGRGGGGAIGDWLRQLGIEYWGELGSLSHRTHLEVSESTCRQGGFGSSDVDPNCAYNHSIYQTGYRYYGRAIGHPGDGDTLSYSLGSTLVQSAGPVWNALLRYMEINRVGSPDLRHTLSPTPQKQYDLQVTYERLTKYGRFHAGLGYGRLDDQETGTSTSDASGFIQWSSN